VSRVLVFGFGNPGRRDDGLGPALVAALQPLAIEGVDYDSDYQLTVEDSVELAQHDTVLFIDASAVAQGPFSFAALGPEGGIGFSSHGVEPAELLGLAEALFGKRPAAYILGIRGYDFETLQEGLTEEAEANLAAALRFAEPLLRERSFAQALAALAATDAACPPEAR